jgi:hypothetical protein
MMTKKINASRRAAYAAKRTKAIAAVLPALLVIIAAYTAAKRAAKRERARPRERARYAANRESIRARQRVYESTKRAMRRTLFYSGACLDCGTTTAKLERDHRDRSTKVNNVARLLHKSSGVFWAEVTKTDLVCQPCHVKRTNSRRRARQLQTA